MLCLYLVTLSLSDSTLLYAYCAVVRIDTAVSVFVFTGVIYVRWRFSVAIDRVISILFT